MKPNEWIRLPAALILALLVFIPAGILSHVVGERIPSELAAQEWLSTSIFQLLMLALAVLLMLAIGRGDLGRFGFQRGTGLPFWRVLRAILVVEVILGILFLPFSRKGPGHFAEDFSFLQVVVSVWIIASTCEEVVTRGLIMGSLAPLSGHGFRIARVRLSAPVVAAAVLFSAMHVPLLVMGIDTALGVQILLGTALLGLIAGYYRERTGSLLPAILAHVAANVFGMGIDALVDLVR